MKKDNRKKGQMGEKLAAAYLEKKKGHCVVFKNYRCPRGEIDLISEIDETIVFTEVKFRKNTHYGVPSQAVDYRKQRHIIQTALWYLHEHKIENKNTRFDVIEILEQNGQFWIRHHENAFQIQ